MVTLHLYTGENLVLELMEYKQFSVRAFEREPGKWRAKIRRADGEPVNVIGGKKLDQSITAVDERTPAAALLMAIAAIDAGMFIRVQAATEKLWRRRMKSDRALTNP
jgi:hypothetical protein